MDFVTTLFESLSPATTHTLIGTLAEALDKRGKLSDELREWVEAVQDRSHILQLPKAA